jgi:hypothetical protein
MSGDPRESGRPRDAHVTREPGPPGRSGGQIGPQHLLEPIGEGGMGEVWLAEQRRPTHDRIALTNVTAGQDAALSGGRIHGRRRHTTAGSLRRGGLR